MTVMGVSGDKLVRNDRSMTNKCQTVLTCTRPKPASDGRVEAVKTKLRFTNPGRVGLA